MVRLIRRGLLVSSLLMCLALSACAGHSVSLGGRPRDLDHARDLAEKIAAESNCGGFEDYSQTAEFWTFSCQKGSRTYEIFTASSRKVRDTRIQTLKDRDLPVKSGDFYVVTMAQSPGQDLRQSDLEDFPGSDAP